MIQMSHKIIRHGPGAAFRMMKLTEKKQQQRDIAVPARQHLHWRLSPCMQEKEKLPSMYICCALTSEEIIRHGLTFRMMVLTERKIM